MYSTNLQRRRVPVAKHLHRKPRWTGKSTLRSNFWGSVSGRGYPCLSMPLSFLCPGISSRLWCLLTVSRCGEWCPFPVRTSRGAGYVRLLGHSFCDLGFSGYVDVATVQQFRVLLFNQANRSSNVRYIRNMPNKNKEKKNRKKQKGKGIVELNTIPTHEEKNIWRSLEYRFGVVHWDSFVGTATSPYCSHSPAYLANS